MIMRGAEWFKICLSNHCYSPDRQVIEKNARRRGQYIRDDEQDGRGMYDRYD